MAGQPLDQIMDKARDIIEAATPDFDSDLAFRRAPMNAPLEQLPISSYRDGTRRFHVVDTLVGGAGAFLSWGSFNGDLVHHLHDAFLVRVRYRVNPRDGGFQNLNDYVSTDRQRIALALVQGGDAWSTYRPSRIEVGSISLAPVTMQPNDPPDTFIMSMVIRVQTFLS